MFSLEKVKRVLFACSMSVTAIGFGAALTLAQTAGDLPRVQIKPALDQPGQMAAVAGEDKTGLAIGLFLQLIALVAVTMALAGHLTLPAKTKSTKP